MWNESSDPLCGKLANAIFDLFCTKDVSLGEQTVAYILNDELRSIFLWLCSKDSIALLNLENMSSMLSSPIKNGPKVSPALNKSSW